LKLDYLERSSVTNVESDVTAQGPATDFYSTVIRNTKPKRLVKKFLVRLLPNHLLEQLKFELHMLLVRLRSTIPFRPHPKNEDLLVNIGAGESGKEGWINLDGFSGPNINYVYDVRKRLPFKNDCVKGIFAEHFFEHIDYTEEAPMFLRECYRVLRPGGVLRIIVPDAEKYMMAYATGGWQEFERIRPLEDQRDYHYGWTYNTRMELVNQVFRQGQQHKFAYDFETMDFLLKRNGFLEVRKQEYGKSVMPEVCIDLKSRRSESLYVEAIK
jgi:predicted SAM-dependent methyltransferase